MGVLSTMAVIGLVGAATASGAAAARVMSPRPSQAQGTLTTPPSTGTQPPTPPTTLATMSQNMLQARDAAGRQRRRAQLPGGSGGAGQRQNPTIAGAAPVFSPKTLIGY